MARPAKKKIEKSGDISLGSGEDFGVPIGAFLEEAAAFPISEEKSSVTSSGVESRQPGRARGSLNSVILRRESAGRGGRTVTVVEARPPLLPGEAEELAKSLRKGLGCGSHVEGSWIILQGDMRERAKAWLIKQGVKKIIMGN